MYLRNNSSNHFEKLTGAARHEETRIDAGWRRAEPSFKESNFEEKWMWEGTSGRADKLLVFFVFR